MPTSVYLKKSGLKRGDFNQIANYVYMQSEISVVRFGLCIKVVKPR